MENLEGKTVIWMGRPWVIESCTEDYVTIIDEDGDDRVIELDMFLEQATF